MDKYDFYNYSELNEQNIKEIKDLAIIVHTGAESPKFNIMELQLRHIISKKYNIPIFDEYFNGLTIAQLIFEVELILLDNMSQDDKNKQAMQSRQAKEELDHLFDDWEEEDKNAWTDMQMDDNISKQLDESVEKFINEGKFIGEE